MNELPKRKHDEQPLDSAEFLVGDDGELADGLVTFEEEKPKRKNDEVVEFTAVVPLPQKTAWVIFGVLIAVLVGCVALLTGSGIHLPALPTVAPVQPSPALTIPSGTAEPVIVVTLDQVFDGAGAWLRVFLPIATVGIGIATVVLAILRYLTNVLIQELKKRSKGALDVQHRRTHRHPSDHQPVARRNVRQQVADVALPDARQPERQHLSQRRSRP